MPARIPHLVDRVISSGPSCPAALFALSRPVDIVGLSRGSLSVELDMIVQTVIELERMTVG